MQAPVTPHCWNNLRRLSGQSMRKVVIEHDEVTDIDVEVELLKQRIFSELISVFQPVSGCASYWRFGDMIRTCR